MAPDQRPERGMRIDQATWRRQEVYGVWKEQYVSMCKGLEVRGPCILQELKVEKHHVNF